MANRVNLQTGDYTIQPQDDNETLVVINAASAATVTLPMPGIGGWVQEGFQFQIANVGAGNVTVAPTGSLIDGAGSLVLTTNQGVALFTDGANYFTVRGTGTGGGGGGGLALETNGTPNGSQTLLNLQEGTGVTITDGGTGTITVNSETAFPFAVIQSAAFNAGPSSFTFTFPQALQASGATALLMFVVDENAAFSTPSGWTKDLDVSDGTLSATSNRLVVLRKASAGDTSVVLSPIEGNLVGQFMELSGTRSLDTSSTGDSGTTNPAQITFPTITPSAGTAVFALAGTATDGSTNALASPGFGPWDDISLNFALAVGNSRCLLGLVYRGAGTGASVTPPALNLQSMQPYPGTGTVWATVSYT